MKMTLSISGDGPDCLEDLKSPRAVLLELWGVSR